MVSETEIHDRKESFSLHADAIIDGTVASAWRPQL